MSLFAPVASAQPEVALARQEFQAGMTAARASDWEAARVHFARSYELNARLSALFNLAGAQAQTGRLRESVASYRAYLAAAAGEPASSRAEAERRLRELEPTIPTLRIEAPGLEDADVVTLDSAPVDAAGLASAIAVDPGEHRVAVVREGTEIVAVTTRVEPSASTSVRLEPPPRPSHPPPQVIETSPQETDLAPPVQVSSVAVEPADPAIDEPSVFESWWFWTIAGAVLVAGAVVAIYFAVPPSEPPGSYGFDPGAPIQVP
jgi:hypothetical protein